MRAMETSSTRASPLVHELVNLLHSEIPDPTNLVNIFYRMNPSFVKGRQVRQFTFMSSLFIFFPNQEVDTSKKKLNIHAVSPLPFLIVSSHFCALLFGFFLTGRCARGIDVSSQWNFEVTGRCYYWHVKIYADTMLKVAMCAHIDAKWSWGEQLHSRYRIIIFGVSLLTFCRWL